MTMSAISGGLVQYSGWADGPSLLTRGKSAFHESFLFTHEKD